MSKDRDGIEDDDRLAPDGSSADDSAGSADLTAEPTDAEILSDPETEVPDALDVEAEIEAAESAEGLEPGSSDDDDSADSEDADAELAGVAAGSSRAGRRSPVRSGVTDKKDAPTKPRDVEHREGPFARLSRFLREVVAELRKVIWPSRKQMITYTIVVIVFLVIMVALVYGMDVLFHLVVGEVLG